MITTAFETITPAVASAMLEGNYDNRKLREFIVEQYANDMTQGRWKPNGAAIVFDTDGGLVDGQHRLRAVIASKSTIDNVVVRGVERETRDTIDIHQVRSSGDILQMFHIPNGNNVAALCRMVIARENGDKKSLGSVKKVGKAAVIERAKTDLRLRYAVTVAATCGHVVRRAPTALCRYIIPDGARSEEFFQRLADGVGLEHGNPVLTLRNWSLRAGRQISFAQSTEATLRAWCAFRDGREITFIKISGELPKP